MSKLEDELELQLNAVKIPFKTEYKFARDVVGSEKGIRKRLNEAGLKDWRFDFVIDHPRLMLAVEVEGGAWTGGRHTRGAGFAGDLRKYEQAQRLGWTIYRCDGKMVSTGNALKTIEILIDLFVVPPNSALCNNPPN